MCYSRWLKTYKIIFIICIDSDELNPFSAISGLISSIKYKNSNNNNNIFRLF